MFHKTSDVSDVTLKQLEPFMNERRGMFTEHLRMKALSHPGRLQANES